ncbi:unnamed protein product, partial [Meganyctiphanes norvegica]
EDFKYGGSITYKCRNGYTLQGEAMLNCQANGAWSAPPPKCVPVSCGEPELPENSIVSGEDFKYGGSITYKCRNGYNLQISLPGHVLSAATATNRNLTNVDIKVNDLMTTQLTNRNSQIPKEQFKYCSKPHSRLYRIRNGLSDNPKGLVTNLKHF